MKRVEGSLGAPSVVKLAELEGLLQEWTSIVPAYAANISKAGNLSVRFEQSKRAKAGKLKIAVLSEGADIEDTFAKGQAWAERDPIARAMVYCAKVEGMWDLVGVRQVRGGDVTERLTAPDMFPEARSLAGGMTKELLSSDECQRLADDLFLDRSWVDDLVWMLNDKRAIVLYGPPGTGKTWLSQQLASRIQQDPARRRLVQLHPSYGYEEFFEGYRPAETKGGLSLAKRDGPLRELTRLADDAPSPVVLCLDEMNRGNLPKVFGELYFLLEYRDHATRLMYSPDEDFKLPRNLYIIGSMNTADRSIVSVDQALRRRFHFVGLFPSEEPVRGMLRRYLTTFRPEMAWVADLVDHANTLLADKNIAIGPSHFMRDDLNNIVLRRVWNHAVLPAIEDHLFGNEERLRAFSLDELLHLVQQSGSTSRT